MPTLAEASLSDAERRTLERFVRMLHEELGDELDAVWLYGSRARGEQPDEESDVDLIVLGRTRSSDVHLRAIGLIHEAAEAEGADNTYFSVKLYDRAWVAGRREIDSFFIQEVDRDKIVLFGEQ
jgi:predicted nucleotidyltransferase